jgi:hypothetical protein
MPIERIRATVENAVNSAVLAGESLGRAATHHVTIPPHLERASAKLDEVGSLVQAIQTILETNSQLAGELIGHANTAQTSITAAGLPAESPTAQKITEHIEGLRGRATFLQTILNRQLTDPSQSVGGYDGPQFQFWSEALVLLQRDCEQLTPKFDDAAHANDQAIGQGQAYLNLLDSLGPDV